MLITAIVFLFSFFFQAAKSLLCHLRSSSSSTNQSFVLVTTQSSTSTPASRRCKSQWVAHLYISPFFCCSCCMLQPLLHSGPSESVVETFCKSHLQALICLVDKKTGEKSKTRPRFVKQDQVCIARLRAAGVICLETFKDFPQMGRFTLRDEGGSSSSLQYSSKNADGQRVIWSCASNLFFCYASSGNFKLSFCPLLPPPTGKTIAIGKVLKLVPEKD